MRPKTHLHLFIQASVIWLVFWLGGWPHYYQQYPPVLVGVACTVLSVVFSLLALAILLRSKPENRMSKALWLSFYYSVPLAVYDIAYCAVYLGLGMGYLVSHWYLTVFYVSIWLTFVPTALLLRSVALRKA